LQAQCLTNSNPSFLWYFLVHISLDDIFMVTSLKFHPHLMNYQIIIIQLLRFISSLPYFIISVPGYLLPFNMRQKDIRFSDLCLSFFVKNYVRAENHLMVLYLLSNSTCRFLWLNCVPTKFICSSTQPKHFRTWLHLEADSLNT
jgi:hypothetical protein